mmetsp:Transcript_7646/g.24290  ORF Transcript_7646/g.24290 Transcript_7646/m.24290 type:complete len:330 (+) Transcript_7646:241-1230(+)
MTRQMCTRLPWTRRGPPPTPGGTPPRASAPRPRRAWPRPRSGSGAWPRHSCRSPGPSTGSRSAGPGRGTLPSDPGTFAAGLAALSLISPLLALPQEDVHRLVVAVYEGGKGIARGGRQLPRHPGRQPLHARGELRDTRTAEELWGQGGEAGDVLPPVLAHASQLLLPPLLEGPIPAGAVQPPCHRGQELRVLPGRRVKPCQQMQRLGCLRGVEGRCLPISIGALHQQQQAAAPQRRLLAGRGLLARRAVGRGLRGLAHGYPLVHEERPEQRQPAPREDGRELPVEARLVPVRGQVPTQGAQRLWRHPLGKDLLEIDRAVDLTIWAAPVC